MIKMMKMMKMMTMLPVACALVIVSFSRCTSSSSSSSVEMESFIYVGCTQVRYNPGSPYESNLNSVLASLVNSASMSNFNKFKSEVESEVVYGVFQCRGDLSNSDCHSCVANAVSRIGTYCVGTSGGALQLDGCFIKYDNTSFIGAQDKSVVSSKCGAGAGAAEDDTMSRRDAVLAYLSGGGQYFRVGGSGKVQGMGQCIQDLSMEQCGDCLSEAIQRLRTDCATSPWGDMFLGKCYARYSSHPTSGYGYTHPSKSESDGNDETEKTLALIIGLIAGVTLLIVFLSFLSKSFDRKDGK